MRVEIACLLLAATAGCGPRAFDNRERTTAATPPGEERPAFDAHDLRALMWKMARATERVNVVMRRSTAPLTPEEQQEVVGLLEEMEAIAARLVRGAPAGNARAPRR